MYTLCKGQLNILDSRKTDICQLSWCLHTFLFTNPPLCDYTLIFMGPHSSLSPFFFFHLPPSLSLCLLIEAGSFTRFWAAKRKTIVLSIKVWICLLCLFISPPTPATAVWTSESSGALSLYLLVQKSLNRNPIMAHRAWLTSWLHLEYSVLLWRIVLEHWQSNARFSWNNSIKINTNCMKLRH